ncbi:MAG: dihydropteroate synthase [Verrucomicrobiota bacterium]|jgi:dihydropteroate synthase
MLKLEDLAARALEHPEALKARVAEFTIGGRPFDFNTTPAIMGVINLSPDSWYRESVCRSTDAAVRRATILAAQGADIIDVGAESTLAHAARVDEQSQRATLVPVITELRRAGLLVSVETYEPSVARSCLEAGANVLNLTGTQHGEEMYRLAASHDAAVILCHVQGDHVRAVGDFKPGKDPVGMLTDYFSRQIDLAGRCGLQRLFLDPGLGFYYRNLQDSAVRVRHQIQIFLNTFRLRTLGFPVCHALPHAFEYFGEEVRCAEPFFAVLAALGKTDLLRTHEVARVHAVIATLKAS